MRGGVVRYRLITVERAIQTVLQLIQGRKESVNETD